MKTEEKNGIWPTRDSVKDYFPLPKEIFSLGLSTAEIAIYAYLLFCEDRRTFQCWPSYRKNGEAVGLSPNTIRPIQTALPCFCACMYARRSAAQRKGTNPAAAGMHRI